MNARAQTLANLDPVFYSEPQRKAMLALAQGLASHPPRNPAVAVYAFAAEKTSPALGLAFAHGCGGALRLNGVLDGAGPAAIMPSPDHWKLFHEIRQRCNPHYVLNKGYFGRGLYFRATRNGMQHDGQPRGETVEAARRFAALGLKIAPMRKTGGHILLCPNSPNWFEGMGTGAQAWINAVERTLSAHSDREIRVRWKTEALRRPLAEDLRDCWAVVVFDSVAGVEAGLAGVPVFATEPCAARAFGCGDLTRIESPELPDAVARHQVASVLAANQWTLEEFRDGVAWRALQGRAP